MRVAWLAVAVLVLTLPALATTVAAKGPPAHASGQGEADGGGHGGGQGSAEGHDGAEGDRGPPDDGSAGESGRGEQGADEDRRGNGGREDRAGRERGAPAHAREGGEDPAGDRDRSRSDAGREADDGDEDSASETGAQGESEAEPSTNHEDPEAPTPEPPTANASAPTTTEAEPSRNPEHPEAPTPKPPTANASAPIPTEADPGDPEPAAQASNATEDGEVAPGSGPNAAADPQTPSPAPVTPLAPDEGADPAAGRAQATEAAGPSTPWWIPGSLLTALAGAAVLLNRPGARKDPRRVSPTPSRETEEADATEAPRAASSPGGTSGLLSLGQEALAAGDLEAASEWFATAIELEPDRQAAHYCLGLCLDERGRLEEAEARLAEARRLEEADPMAAYAHASVLARLGRTREAVEALERLADRAPGLAEAWRDDEDLDDLRDHPRFLALLGEL